MSNLFRKITQALSQAFRANDATEQKNGSHTPGHLVSESTALKCRGDDALKLGRLADAMEYYRQAVSVNPSYAEAYNGLGTVLLTQGGLDEALNCYQQAIKFRPDYAKAHYNLGAALQSQGRIVEATDKYRQALELKPDFVEAHLNLGIVLLAQNQPEAAVDCYHKALVLKPDFAGAHYNLGAVLQALGELKGAVASYQKMLMLLPDDAEVHNNLGNALRDLGKLDEAVASYGLALQIKADFVEAHNNLGNALLDLGKLDEAVASYRLALEIKADFVEAHNNLGNAFRALGRLDEAVASYRLALEIKPVLFEAHNNLGNALRDLGRLDEAVASYRLALEIKPDYAEAHSNLGVAWQASGQLDKAVASYRLALEIKPDYAEAHSNLGNALRALWQLDGAVASYRLALEIKPDFVEARNNLGTALQELGQLDDAVASYRLALEIKPFLFEAHNNLGTALQELGQLDDAVASYRRALEIKPDYAEAHSNLLFCLIQSEGVDAQALFAEHCAFAERFEAPLRANWPRHNNSRNPERCLQVGFVSPDLRHHAVASFIEPLLAQLAGHPRLSLHAYYNHAVEDHVTRRLRGYLPHWHPIVGLSDEMLAQKVREDGIDILIDLSGHTARHRLLCFARKPAPVQISWIGYPGTTGLDAMDYYLSDRFFLPAGQFDDQFTEKLARLPASTPFLPSKDAPPVNALPALSNGYMTFGSFNRPGKINPSVVALWSQLLRALPSARMLLGAMPQAGENATLADWFGREGIVRERLSFHPRCPMKGYLELHHQVDLCLDTFPYNGGTTTLHALWMGVPTLTLAGGTVPSRVGASGMSHFGLEAFVAHSKTEFVEKGLDWAGHLAELAEIRVGLRERFGQSAVGQPAVIAAALERALRTMWQRWCAGLQAESFEIPMPGMGDAMHEADT